MLSACLRVSRMFYWSVFGNFCFVPFHARLVRKYHVYLFLAVTVQSQRRNGLSKKRLKAVVVVAFVVRSNIVVSVFYLAKK